MLTSCASRFSAATWPRRTSCHIIFGTYFCTFHESNFRRYIFQHLMGWRRSDSLFCSAERRSERAIAAKRRCGREFSEIESYQNSVLRHGRLKIRAGKVVYLSLDHWAELHANNTIPRQEFRKYYLVKAVEIWRTLAMGNSKLLKYDEPIYF